MTNGDLSFIHPEELLKSLGIRANQTVVHLGCGVGYYVIPAAKMVGRHGHVFGIDIRPDVLAELASHARRDRVQHIVTAIHSDLENGATAGLARRCADWTLVVNVLFQADPEKVLAEAERITKQGGDIVIVEWNTSSTPLGPPNNMRVSKVQIETILTKLKLKITGEFSPSPYHYGLLIQV